MGKLSDILNSSSHGFNDRPESQGHHEYRVLRAIRSKESPGKHPDRSSWRRVYPPRQSGGGLI